MKADCIIKNAKIFTADRDHPQASALVVKDGKYVYVGDDAGLSEYEGFSFNKPRDVYFGGKKMTIAGPAPRK